MGLKYFNQEWKDYDVRKLMREESLYSLTQTQKNKFADIWPWIRSSQLFDDFIFYGKEKVQSKYLLKSIITINRKQKFFQDMKANSRQKCNHSNFYSIFGVLSDNIYLIPGKQKTEEWKNIIKQKQKEVQDEEKKKQQQIELAKKVSKTLSEQIEMNKESDELFFYSVEQGKVNLKKATSNKRNNYLSDIRDKLKWAYVYSIQIDGQVVYVGSTKRPIKERLGQHIACSLKEEGLALGQQNYLYQTMRENPYQFKILWKAPANVCNVTQMEAMECGFISLLKPKFNYEGMKVAFNFTVDKLGRVFKGEEDEE